MGEKKNSNLIILIYSRSFWVQDQKTRIFNIKSNQASHVKFRLGTDQVSKNCILKPNRLHGFPRP